MAALKSVSAQRVAVRPARSAVVVKASSESVDRRSVFGFVAAAASLALLAPEAKAVKIPSQESTGGMGTGGGNMTKSSTAATMEGYTLEGTKKQGISAKQRKKLLAKARADAEKAKAN